MNNIKSYIKLLRVDQWLKNFFIFAPIVFSFNFEYVDAIIKAAIAFIGFSFIASSIYVINDWFDIETDRLHPKKKNRPLASGAVSQKEALILLLVILVIGVSIFLIVLQNYKATLLVVGYLLLNLAYSFKLKQYAIIDISIVASGFVIRVFVGGFVTGCYLSHWIIILTFLLALLLVLGKRKHDVSIFEQTGQKMRKSVAGYNSGFLNAIIIVVSAMTIIAYIMYTISPEIIKRNGEHLYLTSVFVILGVFRYLQVVFLEKGGDNPTKLFIKDRFIHIDLVCWLVSFVAISLLKDI